jgi:hypothetical protein
MARSSTFLSQPIAMPSPSTSSLTTSTMPRNEQSALEDYEMYLNLRRLAISPLIRIAFRRGDITGYNTCKHKLFLLHEVIEAQKGAPRV